MMCVMLLSACSGPYEIKGRVVRGSIAMIQVVPGDDARLKEENPTGGGAVIEAVLEPNTPTERLDLGRHITDGQGYFAIPVDAFGASILEYEALIIARRAGNQGAMKMIELPRRGRRVLITLPQGVDDLVVPESEIDRALRDAKPYLDN